MSFDEEQLYYACSNFCDAFFKYMCTKNENETGRRLTGRYIEEREIKLRFEQKRLQSAFDRLKEAVSKVGEDS